MASILLKGRLPEPELQVDDFAVPEHQDIFRAMQVIDGWNEPITLVEVWNRNRRLDPVRLCEIENSLTMSERSRTIDAYASLVTAHATIRRQERAA